MVYLSLQIIGIASMILAVQESDVEHFQVYKTENRAKWSCWAGTWFIPEGHIRVSFLDITGGPADLEPSYRYEYTSPAMLKEYGIKRNIIWCESKDEGRTWQKIKEINASDTMDPLSQGARFLLLDDGKLLAFGGIWAKWNDKMDGTQGRDDNYVMIGHAMVWESSEDGQQLSTPVSLNSPDEMRAFWCCPKKLSDGTIVMPAYGTYDIKDPSPSTDAWLWFSRDKGKSWSAPLLLTRGTETRTNDEPEIEELSNGDLIVMLRHSNPKVQGSGVYLNCGQIIVKRTDSGWEAGPLTPTNMEFRGFPALLRTSNGILICAGSGDRFNFSLNDGKTWSATRRIFDPKYNRTNHYPRLLELSDGRILSIYHVGNHWPYPPPQEQWMHATSFRIALDSIVTQ